MLKKRKAPLLAKEIVREMCRMRMRETHSTNRDVAECAGVPETVVENFVSGRSYGPAAWQIAVACGAIDATAAFVEFLAENPDLATEETEELIYQIGPMKLGEPEAVDLANNLTLSVGRKTLKGMISQEEDDEEDDEERTAALQALSRKPLTEKDEKIPTEYDHYLAAVHGRTKISAALRKYEESRRKKV